jgi:hypothetical protein
MENLNNVGPLFTIATTLFVAGGFYVLTSWRLKALEKAQQKNDDTNARLISIETKLDIFLKQNSVSQ